jgi:hypothetical protein
VLDGLGFSTARRYRFEPGLPDLRLPDIRMGRHQENWMNRAHASHSRVQKEIIERFKEMRVVQFINESWKFRNGGREQPWREITSAGAGV